jgi:hypothetical protein
MWAWRAYSMFASRVNAATAFPNRARACVCDDPIARTEDVCARLRAIAK